MRIKHASFQSVAEGSVKVIEDVEEAGETELGGDLLEEIPLKQQFVSVRDVVSGIVQAGLGDSLKLIAHSREELNLIFQCLKGDIGSTLLAFESTIPEDTLQYDTTFDDENDVDKKMNNLRADLSLAQRNVDMLRRIQQTLTKQILARDASIHQVKSTLWRHICMLKFQLRQAYDAAQGGNSFHIHPCAFDHMTVIAETGEASQNLMQGLLSEHDKHCHSVLQDLEDSMNRLVLETTRGKQNSINKKELEEKMKFFEKEYHREHAQVKETLANTEQELEQIHAENHAYHRQLFGKDADFTFVLERSRFEVEADCLRQTIVEVEAASAEGLLLYHTMGTALCEQKLLTQHECNRKHDYLEHMNDIDRREYKPVKQDVFLGTLQEDEALFTRMDVTLRGDRGDAGEVPHDRESFMLDGVCLPQNPLLEVGADEDAFFVLEVGLYKGEERISTVSALKAEGYVEGPECGRIAELLEAAGIASNLPKPRKLTPEFEDRSSEGIPAQHDVFDFRLNIKPTSLAHQMGIKSTCDAGYSGSDENKDGTHYEYHAKGAPKNKKPRFKAGRRTKRALSYDRSDLKVLVPPGSDADSAEDIPLDNAKHHAVLQDRAKSLGHMKPKVEAVCVTAKQQKRRKQPHTYTPQRHAHSIPSPTEDSSIHSWASSEVQDTTKPALPPTSPQHLSPVHHEKMATQQFGSLYRPTYNTKERTPAPPQAAAPSQETLQKTPTLRLNQRTINRQPREREEISPLDRQMSVRQEVQRAPSKRNLTKGERRGADESPTSKGGGGGGGGGIERSETRRAPPQSFAHAKGLLQKHVTKRRIPPPETSPTQTSDSYLEFQQNTPFMVDNEERSNIQDCCSQGFSDSQGESSEEGEQSFSKNPRKKEEQQSKLKRGLKKMASEVSLKAARSEVGRALMNNGLVSWRNRVNHAQAGIPAPPLSPRSITQTIETNADAVSESIACIPQSARSSPRHKTESVHMMHEMHEMQNEIQRLMSFKKSFRKEARQLSCVSIDFTNLTRNEQIARVLVELKALKTSGVKGLTSAIITLTRLLMGKPDLIREVAQEDESCERESVFLPMKAPSMAFDDTQSAASRQETGSLAKKWHATCSSIASLKQSREGDPPPYAPPMGGFTAAGERNAGKGASGADGMRRLQRMALGSPALLVDEGGGGGGSAVSPGPRVLSSCPGAILSLLPEGACGGRSPEPPQSPRDRPSRVTKPSSTPVFRTAPSMPSKTTASPMFQVSSNKWRILRNGDSINEVV